MFHNVFQTRHVRRKLCTPPPPCYHVVLLYFISYFSLQFFNQVIRYSMSRRNVRPNLHPYSSRVFQISNLPVKNFNRGGAPVRVQRYTGDPPHYIPLGTCPSHHAPFFVKLINQFIMYSTVNRAIALSCDDTLHCTLL